MTIAELYRKGFNKAAEELTYTNDTVTTYESLKDFATAKIDSEHLFVAIHILQAINDNPADFYDYDYCMGTLDTPTPLTVLADLVDYCEEEMNNE